METRKYIIITTIGHTPRYYNGWEVVLSAEQLTVVCVATNLQERYHHKSATTYLYERQEDTTYQLSGVFGGVRRDTLRNTYSAEEMEELKELINRRK